MEITGLTTGAASAITGLVSHANSTMYIFLAFLIMILAILVISKLFNLVLMYVSVAIMGAIAPFIINMFWSSAFGYNILNVTPNLILYFMGFSVLGIGVYKLVYWILGIIEHILHTGSKIVHKVHRKGHHDEHKKHEEDE